MKENCLTWDLTRKAEPRLAKTCPLSAMCNDGCLLDSANPSLEDANRRRASVSHKVDIYEDMVMKAGAIR